jgi:two-component system sensor histidine kinase and response regulator WspE
MTDAEDDPLLELFRAELREQAALLSRGLLDLERAPDDPQPLEALIAAAHTVRGAARLISLDAAGQLAAGLEDLFAAVQTGRRRLDAADLDVCLRVSDTLAALTDLAPAEWTEQRASDIAVLGAALARGQDEPKASPAPPVPTEREPQTPPSPAAAEFVPLADPSLLELFREEVRVHAATLNDGLLGLEREPANPQRIEPLMRAAHSIKGAARIVGLEPAVRLAHELEDAFVAAQNARIRIAPTDIDLFLRCADLLAALSEGDLGRWVVERQAEVTQLRGVITAIARGEAPQEGFTTGNTGDTGEEKRPRMGEEAGPSSLTSVVPASSSPLSFPVSPVSPVVNPSAEPAESVVRVTAGSLNRLMSLAGESLVQARWLQPFAASLLLLKKDQDRLAAQLDALAQTLATGGVSAPAGRAGTVPEALTEVGGQVARCRQVLAERIGAFEGHAAQAEDLNSRLYREVIVSRMRPFADGAGGFPRLVRDTARQLGKQARLEIAGQTTEVDRDILEKLEAPLTHLLRNAVDHGLESPDNRSVAGKPAEGIVCIEARHRAGMLAITVSDDGAGIDVERIRKKAVERGHATAEMAGRLSEAELLEFLFLPGFSTAGRVTEVSGRGVGLDVVQDTVRRVGGSVHISTRPGRGTTFHLLLPLTLSVLRAVLVDIAGEPYAFPHNRIDRLLRVPRTEVRSLEHRHFIVVDGRTVGLVLAAQLLDLPTVDRSTVDGQRSTVSDDLPVLLLSDATGTYGLIVEAFRGEQDLVVRPLDPRLGKVPNVSAAAILDDGTPVLIADAEDLIRSMDQFIQAGTLRRCDDAAGRTTAKKRVLVVDDSITVREVQRQILRTHGYEVEVAVDGQDGWNRVQAEAFDLVISDVDMPRMNGLEFVRRIREDGAWKELPVIVVSYKDRDEDRLRGLEAGANHYLTKSSFHDHTFLEAVSSLIGRG